MKFPCIGCITFPMCKERFMKSNADGYVLVDKCDIIKELFINIRNEDYDDTMNYLYEVYGITLEQACEMRTKRNVEFVKWVNEYTKENSMH